ncbi:sensor histidine kinase [Planococcus sp. CPCC 101016]|uniref:sensor histidine kinase n=1 Tax=Planococcus sp. CPCC 101016 TaxID=2599617 RepID=UPI0011B70F1E|nr:ATP-binding protein [Planococcus sp. CPCC 101016]TWT06580.1 sensor histidine kinase [Planococcus sp. CPCC 101016]
MNRQPIFRKQQLRFMILNLIAFSIIFTIFGFIIFHQVQNTLFSETDEELQRTQEFVASDNVTDFRSPLAPEEENRPEQGPPRDVNPRIIIIDWNAEGDIVNEDQIGTFLYENVFQDYTPDIETLNTITNTSIDDEYTFRYLLIEDETIGDDVAYTQILVNIDAEQTILDNFGRLLIICSLIFIILSISASYILSKKMMQPIIQSWNKQAEFVENASHELRTPLTIIQNKLELLLMEPQQKIMQKFENIALSLSETRRLSKLTSDLLTLARADSAEIQLDKQTLHVDEFIERVSAPYIEIAESQNKTLQLELNCSVQIKADEVRLHQLLVILLDNALKYTDEKQEISVKTYTEDQKVAIEVNDNGRGIEKENLPYIFDRFYRVDKARSRENGGVGLGLSIAQWIVINHGGTIAAFQNEKAGTTFKVKLPY